MKTRWERAVGSDPLRRPQAGSLPLAFPMALLLAAVAVRLWIGLGVYRYFIDDAYIFMRYAENFSAGRGLVFNPGEWVLGFTSPLFTLVLTALTRVFSPHDAAPVIVVLNAICFLVFAIVLLKLFFDGTLRSLALPALLLLYFPFIDASLNGMETMLMLATMFATLFLLARLRLGLAVVAAALCALTRPEGFVWFAFVTAFLLWTERHRFPRLAWFGMTAVGLAWAAFAQWRYGSFLPQSLVAKSSHAWQVARAVESTPFEMHLYLSTAITDTLFQGLGARLRLAATLAASAATLLFALGAVQLARWRSPLVIAAGFYAVVLALYAVGNPVDLSSWHTIPTAAAFFVVAFAGLESLVRRWRSVVVDVLLVGAVLAFCVVSLRVALPRRTVSINAVQGSMERLGAWVREKLPGARSIASGHIGLLGRRADLRIVDLGALVTPGVLDYGSLGELIEKEQPDVLMLAPTILTDGADPKYPRPFRDAGDRARFLATYVASPRPGMPHVFVRRTLLPAAATGASDSTRAPE